VVVVGLVEDPAGGRQIVTNAICRRARKGRSPRSSGMGSATRALKRRTSRARSRTGWMKA
jgi:hypothetical protein